MARIRIGNMDMAQKTIRNAQQRQSVGGVKYYIPYSKLLPKEARTSREMFGGNTFAERNDDYAEALLVRAEREMDDGNTKRANAYIRFAKNNGASRRKIKDHGLSLSAS